MPQPPQIKEGFFNLYVEKIDNLVMSLALPPKCYMCDRLLELGEKVVTIRIRGMPNRYCTDCYDQLVIGIYLFNERFEDMEAHTSGLQ